jgi:hypothetical protein
MNQVIQNLIKNFLEENEIRSESDPKDFEKFCNYSIISNHYNGNFTDADVTMGDTQGIDGLAIIINGALIKTKKEIEDMISTNGYIEVEFIFIQAKNSESFDVSDIGNFFSCVEDFFSTSPGNISTQEIKNALELKNKILENVSKMTKGRPKIKLYYTTTGRWNNEAPLNNRIKQSKTNLDNLGIFDEIRHEMCGSREIQDIYMRTKRNTACEFIFDKRISLNTDDNVQEAYLGAVNFNEFKKIIIDEEGNLKDVFYDNVRDFLGDNIQVNRGIDESLKAQKYSRFCLLNNGVTIVAEQKTNVGDKFTIENYQIVNGCQTSHVLFNNKNLDGIKNVVVPLKLIISNNENLQNAVIIATNSQTAIPKEQLEAFSKFQKELEMYYSSVTPEKAKLYYERRQKQYKNVGISIPKIVNIREQIKTFVAMFLNQPHLSSGYFSKAYKNNESKMFQADHKFCPYYIASFAMYKLEKLFKDKILDKKYRIARYHLLMIFRILANKTSIIPTLNSRHIDAFCEKLKQILLDDKKTKAIFVQAIKIIDSIPEINLDDQSTLYKANITTIKTAIEKSISNN